MASRGAEWTGFDVHAELWAIFNGPRLSAEEAGERMRNGPMLRAMVENQQREQLAAQYHDDGERVPAAEWVVRLSEAALTRRLEESAARMAQWNDGGPVQLSFIAEDAGRQEQTMLQLVSEARRRLHS